MTNIATVISYCTNDYRFIGKCIDEARRFSSQIVVPVSDHFFNGQPENRQLLNHTYAAHPDCTFVEFAFDPNRLYTAYTAYRPSDDEWLRLWHQTSRYIGFLHLRPEIDFLLFLDCDEIPEGDRVAEWLQTGEYQKWNALRLLVYYYVLRPTLRATTLQEVPLLVRRASLEPRFFFHPDERYALYRYVEGPKRQEVRGLSQKPLFHHYSWVRTSSECLQKSGSWGHRSTQDWPKEIQRAFAEKQKKNLFGTDLEFEEISDPYFDPLSVSTPTDSPALLKFPHVKKVNHRDIFQMELSLAYGDSYSH